jgi:hypothetical protein
VLSFSDFAGAGESALKVDTPSDFGLLASLLDVENEVA